MTRRTPGRHDPDVSTDEWAERVDIDHDHYPTRAELADEPPWWPPKDVRADTPLLAALQAGVERGTQ